MQSSKKKILIISVALLVICIFCLLCLASVLVVKRGVDSSKKKQEAENNGTLIIYSFSEVHKNETDVFLEDFEFYSLLKIFPKVNNKEIYVTDSKGKLELSVPPGNYALTPVYANSTYQMNVKVEKGETVTEYVYTPNTTIYLYGFNFTEEKFKDLAVRKGISEAIERSDYLKNSLTDFTAVTDFFPDGLEMDLKNVKRFSPSMENAKETLKDITPFSFTALLVENKDGSEPYGFSILKNSCEATEKMTDIKYKTLIWEDFEIAQKQGEFEFTSMYWVFDSNNMLPFFDYFFGKKSMYNYQNSEVQDLIADGYKALNKGDLSEYETIIVQINNLLVEDAAAVPIYTGKINLQDDVTNEVF